MLENNIFPLTGNTVKGAEVTLELDDAHKIHDAGSEEFEEQISQSEPSTRLDDFWREIEAGLENEKNGKNETDEIKIASEVGTTEEASRQIRRGGLRLVSSNGKIIPDIDFDGGEDEPPRAA